MHTSVHDALQHYKSEGVFFLHTHTIQYIVAIFFFSQDYYFFLYKQFLKVHQSASG